MIPHPDPLPLPAPVWLFQALMILTFALHLLAMNFLVGGLLWSLLSEWRARRGDERHKALLQDIKAALPNVMAPTITLGVAPLLFVQVLYGQALFTSSILTGWYWLAIVPILIVAYYGLYLRYWRGGRYVSPLAAVVSLVLLLVVLLIFVNNMSLMLRPDRWEAIYRARDTGFGNNLDDGQFWPRVLHIVVATLAVGSAGVAFLGWKRSRQEPELGGWMVRLGGRGFTLFTALQVIFGPLFLWSQPASIRNLFLGGNTLYTVVAVVSILFAVGAVYLVWQAMRGSSPTRPLWLGGGLLLLTLLGMAWNRQHLREAYLLGSVEPGTLPVAAQTGIILLWVILFVAGLATLGWMLRVYMRGNGLKRAA